ncbi:LLM class flavin-dependent oxidoreductase [Ktedonospora formicarum]|uniref:Luciferase-like protein n=1 Tax=Ktedonospora formicarum TaxID=2778364 RepID=A0A8J3HZ05_9CHLR|nr:LLM class flavin-dependent oxidoreductase [Ktedonospora formicarum]GHO46832.1 luciferase-like protein [Ktedonospora formicarum]
MKYGFILMGEPNEVVELAQEAEQAGWDGVFLPDNWMTAWILLTAIATCTKRIALGTMLTPLPEQPPWYIAAQTATLDQLSNGRVILTAGLGVLELDKFGMQDNKVRAQRLDEALELINIWWQGEPSQTLTYEGRHYHLQEMQASVDWRTQRPVQTPRIPIWVIGGVKQSQLRRAARWDGAVINGKPDEIGKRKTAIEELREGLPLRDIIVEGETPPNDPERAGSIVRPFAEAGATWWLESMWEWEGISRAYDIRTRVRSGPPRY